MGAWLGRLTPELQLVLLLDIENVLGSHWRLRFSSTVFQVKASTSIGGVSPPRSRPAVASVQLAVDMHDLRSAPCSSTMAECALGV